MPPKSKKKQKSTTSNTNRHVGISSQSAASGPRASSSTSNPTSAADRSSKWTPENIEKRLKQREDVSEARRKGIEALKAEGNKRYQSGDYHGALNIYTGILDQYNGHPVVFSNIAQTLLKLENYRDAELMAMEALKRDPANTKSRFRRALARKGLNRYIAALADISTVLSANPLLEDAREEQREITRLIDECTEGLEEPYLDNDADETGMFGDMDPDFPPFNQPPLVFEEEDVESDSEDAHHNGNGIPCKFYNHGTCTNGDRCKYSHAPDDRSQRDKLGRNVCNYYLLGDCPHGQKCNYCHDKTYIGDGWWNHDIVIAKGRSLFEDRVVPRELAPDLSAFIAGAIRREQRNAGGVPALEGMRFDYSLKEPGQQTGTATPAAPTPKSRSSPFVMLLALEYGLDLPFQQPTLNALKSKVPIKIIESSSEATTHLSSPDLVAVVATDGAIAAPGHAGFLSKLVDYVKMGGRLILAGGFTSFVRPDKANALFSKFGLPWKFGNYYRTTFSLNRSSLLCNQAPNLPSSYSMKAVDLENVNREQAIYLPEADGYRSSQQQPPVIYAPVAAGFLGYIGDVNWEDESIPVLLAMLGPLESPSRGVSGATTGTSTPPTSTVSCTSSTHSTPDFILLLSLQRSSDFSAKFQRLLSALAARVNYDQATDMPTALNKMKSPDMKGVLVTDGGIMNRSNAPVLVKLIQYAKDGGNVVYGAEFGKAHYALASEHFQCGWLLSWSITPCDRMTGVFTVKHALAKRHPDLPKAYTMMASQVSEPHTKEIVYVSYGHLEALLNHGDDSDSDSEYSFPRDDLEAPIVRTKIEKGHLAYAGDVNVEEGTVEVLLALLAPSPTQLKASSSATKASSTTSTPVAHAPKPPPDKPFTLVLTFDHAKEFATKHADALEAIERSGSARAEVVHGLSVQRVLDLMKSSSLLWIFVPYADIMMPEHEYLVSKLVEFTKSGGVLVFGGYFAGSAQHEQIGPFFSKWGLNWRADKNAIVTANMVANLENGFTQTHCPRDMPRSQHMKALQLSGVTEDEAVYITVPEGRMPRITRSPVVFTQVEEGNLGFVGDTTFSKEHLALVLLMLRAL